MSWIPEDLVKGEPVPWHAFDAMRNAVDRLRALYVEAGQRADKAEQERKKWKDDYWTAIQKLSQAQTALAYAHKALEDQGVALAQQEQDLLAYKDYYGTSVVQVKHLQECTNDACVNARTHVCLNYPTE